MLDTLKAGYELLARGILLSFVKDSVFRAICGWVVGCAIGIPAGWIIGHYTFVGRIMEPYVNFFRFIPPIVWVTMFLLWFGYNEITRVGLVAYSVAVICVVNSIVGTRAVPETTIRAAKTLGIKGFNLLRHIEIPASVPQVLTGMRISMGAAFMTIVAVEMLTASSGLGYMIWVARLYWALEQALIGIALLGILGFFSDYLLKKVGNRFMWKYGIVY